MFMKKILFFISLLLAVIVLYSQETSNNKREKLLLDFGWRFAYGHPFDTKKDFGNGIGHFYYFAKAGYGDGAR